jgi:hypothetical protein
MKRLKWVKWALLCVVTVACAQQRFETGEMKGFTKSPTEHIVERLDDQVPVRRVEGIVTSKSLSKPLAGVLVEIRGPGANEKVTSAVTDRNGRFKFRQLPEGDYAIKITSNGFRSVFGRVSVQPSAKQSRPLRIELLHGV